jgi:type IV secretion system protein VirB4
VFRFKERAVSDYIPLVGHARDDVLLHDDGSLTIVVWFGGIAWQTEDVATIIQRQDDYHNALRNMSDDTLTISTYQCRGMADPSIYPKRILPSPFARLLDERYRENLFAGALFDNQIYVAITIHPASYVPKFVSGQIKKRSKPAKEARADRLRRLYETADLLEAKLGAYRPRRLGLRRVGHVLFSEMAEALVFAMTGIWRPIGLSTGTLKKALFSERIIFGREAIEIRTPGWSTFAAVFGMREYPTGTYPGMFAALSTAPYRCTLFHSFRFLGKATAESTINRKQNYMVGAEDKAFEQLDELRQAGNDLMANKMVLGNHSLSLIAFADSIDDLTRVATRAWRNLADSGAVVARESAALEAAFFSLIPCNERLQPRPGFISSRNFTAMAPLHNFPAGPGTSHWGEPIALLRTTAATPYRFHWHVDGVGNTLVTGQTGSGKTLLTGHLIAMTAGRARVIALDYKRGWELLFRAMEGDYSVLGDGEPHLAPLKALSATPKNLTFLGDLIRGCIRRDLDDEEDRRLRLALQIVMAMPPEHRSMGEIAAFLGSKANGAGAALQRWCWGNDLGWVIDAPVNTVNLRGDLQGIDLTAILENPRARGPALLTLFHYIELQIDGRPILIPNDEGWRALQDEKFRPMIERRLRTIRSFGGAFVFLTQGPDEIKQSGIGKVLVEQCPTQIMMPVDRATREDYTDVLKCTEGEWEAFSQLRKGEGRFLIRQGAQSVIAELPLHGMDDEIATLSANQESLNALDEVRKALGHKNGERPHAMLPAVHKRRREIIEKRLKEMA